MKRCNVCGKNYSDGYDVCPFCGGKRRAARKIDTESLVEMEKPSSGSRLVLGMVLGSLLTATIVLLLMFYLNRIGSTPQVQVVQPDREPYIAGSVMEAEDQRTAVEGAAVEFYVDSELKGSRNTDAQGAYNILLPTGEYAVNVTKADHIPFLGYAESPMDMETIMLVRTGEPGEEGGASGTIKNRTDGQAVPNATLSFLEGWNAFLNGMTVQEVEQRRVAETTTDEEGKYTIELPLGYYTIVITGDGLNPAAFNIYVKSGETDQQNGTVQPVIEASSAQYDDFLVTLTWGATPADLDSHMQGLAPDGSPFHVYFSDKTALSSGSAFCQLDVDDTTSYGPEHITLDAESDKTYYYYIHRYSSSGTLGESGAQVTIEVSNDVKGTYNVPTGGDPNDRYWNVFAIKDGQIIVRNTITSSPEISYAG